MEKLSFGTFTWTQNPESVHIVRSRSAVYEKNTAGEQIFSGMSESACTVHGSGSFSGNGAYDAYRALASLFESGACATLSCPQFGQMQAYFTQFDATIAGKRDFVSYTFTFTRCDPDGVIAK